MITDTLNVKNAFIINYETLVEQGLGKSIRILSVKENRVAYSPRRVIVLQYTIARGSFWLKPTRNLGQIQVGIPNIQSKYNSS